MNPFKDVVTLDKCEKYAGQKVGANETYRICRGLMRQLKAAKKDGTGLPEVSYYAAAFKGYVWSLAYKDTVWKVVISTGTKMRFRVIGWGNDNGFYPVMGIWMDLKKSSAALLLQTFYELNRAGELNFGNNFECYTDYCKDLGRFRFWAKVSP